MDTVKNRIDQAAHVAIDRILDALNIHALNNGTEPHPSELATFKFLLEVAVGTKITVIKPNDVVLVPIPEVAAFQIPVFERLLEPLAAIGTRFVFIPGSNDTLQVLRPDPDAMSALEGASVNVNPASQAVQGYEALNDAVAELGRAAYALPRLTEAERRGLGGASAGLTSSSWANGIFTDPPYDTGPRYFPYNTGPRYFSRAVLPGLLEGITSYCGEDPLDDLAEEPFDRDVVLGDDVPRDDDGYPILPRGKW